MPASHSRSNAPPRAEEGAHADDDPMDILRCLLFAGTVTLAIALVVRALGRGEVQKCDTLF